jgi:hypothetical protein
MKLINIISKLFGSEHLESPQQFFLSFFIFSGDRC